MKNVPIQVFTNNLDSLCLQVEYSSDLVLSVAPEGWKIIWYFYHVPFRYGTDVVNML